MCVKTTFKNFFRKQPKICGHQPHVRQLSRVVCIGVVSPVRSCDTDESIAVSCFEKVSVCLQFCA